MILSEYITRLIFVLSLLMTIGCEKPSHETTDSQYPVLTMKIDSLVQSEIDQEHIPGAAILVKKDGGILYRNALGYAHLFDKELKRLQNPEPLTTDHIFDLASLTKVLGTTFAIMLLNDRGMVGLDDAVHQYLHDFGKGDKRKITIRRLLNHTSGLEQWLPFYYKASNREEQYRVITGRPLAFEVGEARHYSDAGFMVLGDLVEQVSGLPLDRFLEQELYGPLGINQTVFNPLERGFKKIAATSHGNPFEKKMVYEDDFGYSVDVNPESWNGWRNYTLKGEVNDGNAWHANRGVAGHAGLFSTLDDIQVLTGLLLNKGKFNGTEFISEDTIEAFLTKDKYGNGLGWAMDPSIFSAVGAPEGTFGHTGFTGTSVVVVPEYKLTIIMLTNRQNVGLTEDGYYFDLSDLRQSVFDEVISTIRHKNSN